MNLRASRPTSRFLILGCGHTGTTLVSGIFHINGYRSFRVSRLFENMTLNDINKEILSGRAVSTDVILKFLRRVERRSRGSWCLKDPRLSETAATYYKLIDHPVKIIVNFREPSATIRSLRKELEVHCPHLSPEEMQRDAEAEYISRTEGCLMFVDTVNRSPVLYVNYDRLIEGHDLDMLSRFVGRSLDMSLIQPQLRRSTPMHVSEAVLRLHREVERRYAENQESIRAETDPVPVRVVTEPTLRTRSYVEFNKNINRGRKVLQILAQSGQKLRTSAKGSA